MSAPFSKGLASLVWAPAPNVSGYALVRDGVAVATAGPSAVSTRFSVTQGKHILDVYANPAAVTTTIEATTTTSSTTQVTTTAPTTTTVPTTTTTVPVTTTSPPPSSASVFIATTGNDSTCARGGWSLPCATPQHACSLAQPGDTIEVGGGTYSIGFTLTGCNPTSAVFFVNQPGTDAFFAADSTISNSSNITLQGDRVGHGVGFSLGSATFNGTNITLNNINAYCQPQAPWDTVTYGGHTYCNASWFPGGTNFTWNGGDSSMWAQCAVSGCTHTGSGSNNNQINGGNGILIEHITMHNIFVFTAADHSELWKINGGTNITFLDNRLYDCNPPPGLGFGVPGCTSAVVFFGQAGSAPTADYVSFIQNVLDSGNAAGGKSIDWGYDSPALNEYHASFLYNTMTQSYTLCGGNANYLCGGTGNTATITGRNVTQVGNIAQKTGSCFTAETNSHNVWFTTVTTFASKCDATDTQKTNTTFGSIWTAAGAAPWDWSLSPTSPALSAGENIYCPAQDIDGNARPAATACDAGAEQRPTTAPSSPSASLWVSAAGSSTCARSAQPVDYQTAVQAGNVCGSFNAAYQAASAGDLVLVKNGSYGAQSFATKAISGPAVTFRAETPLGVTVQPANTAANGTALFVNSADWLTFEGFRINPVCADSESGCVATNFGAIEDTSSLTNLSTHVTFDGNAIAVGVYAGGQIVTLHAAQDWTFTHNTFGPSCCGLGEPKSPVPITVGKPSGAAPDCTSEACNITISDNLFQYAVRQTIYWPSTWPLPPGTTTCTLASCHLDSVHVWGVIGMKILRNRFYGDECTGIFFEGTNNSLNKNIDIVGNSLSTIAGQCNGAISLNGVGTSGHDWGGTINIGFNESPAILNVWMQDGAFEPGTVWNFYGNYMPRLFQFRSSGGVNSTPSCYAGGSLPTNVTVHSEYNVWRSDIACSATDKTGTTPSWVNSAAAPATGLDMDKTGAAGAADDAVVCSALTVGCPAADMDGDPFAATADAGADQR